MLLGSIHDPSLRFPRHRVLDEHLIKAVLTFLIPDGEVFPWRITIRRRTICLIRLEIDDENLRMRIIHRHADLYVMAHLVVAFCGSENMPQCIWKNEWMLVDLRTVPGFFCRGAPQLHDAKLKGDKFMFFFVTLHNTD